MADGAVGVMGGLGGLTGPEPTLWCTSRGRHKDARRSIFQVFNLAMHSLTLTVYFLNGTLTRVMLSAFVVMVPAAVVPTVAGVLLYRRVDDQVFRRLVLILLWLSGIVLLLSVELPWGKPILVRLGYAGA